MYYQVMLTSFLQLKLCLTIFGWTMFLSLVKAEFPFYKCHLSGPHMFLARPDKQIGDIDLIYLDTRMKA